MRHGDERDEKRERRRKREVEAGLGYRVIDEVLDSGVSPEAAALAWLGAELAPKRAESLRPPEKTFRSWKATEERILDVTRFGIARLPLLVACGVVDYLTNERNGYELSTRGSRRVERIITEVKLAASKDEPTKKDWNREFESLTEISEADSDEIDEEGPYGGVTYGEYVYGSEMEGLRNAADGAIALVGLAQITLNQAPVMPDPSAPTLMDYFHDLPVVRHLKSVLDEAGSACGCDFAADEEVLREFFGRAAEPAIEWLKKHCPEFDIDESERCQCGTITGEPWCKNALTLVRISWVPPANRETALRLASWRGLEQRLRVHPQCIESLRLHEDPWIDVNG